MVERINWKEDFKDEDMNESENIDNQELNGVLPCVTKRYFHELEQTEIDTLIADKKTVGYIMAKYKKPHWCNHPEALSMAMGCWSLCDLSKDGLRTKISEDFCKDCICFSL